MKTSNLFLFLIVIWLIIGTYYLMKISEKIIPVEITCPSGPDIAVPINLPSDLKADSRNER